MCYMDTYQCSIRCINSDLNISEAMNGTITGMYPYMSHLDDRCRVVSCSLVEHFIEGSSANVDITSIGYNSVIPLLIIAVIILAMVTVWYLGKQ